MPIIYPKKIREALKSIDLEILKNEIINNGFTFIRDGGFRPEDKPFKFSNYLFYINNETGMRLRIGYNYPLSMLTGNGHNVIFEICYCPKDFEWWIDITPDFRKNKWRIISDRYGYLFKVGDTVRNKQTGITKKIVCVTDKNYMFVNDIYIFNNEDGFSKANASNWEKI